MTNGNEPIQAVYSVSGKAINESDMDWITAQKTYVGLTKREYFAAMAMQGMLSSGCYSGENSQYLTNIKDEAKPRCKDAVGWADSLIEALNK